MEECNHRVNCISILHRISYADKNSFVSPVICRCFAIADDVEATVHIVNLPLPFIARKPAYSRIGSEVSGIEGRILVPIFHELLHLMMGKKHGCGCLLRFPTAFDTGYKRDDDDRQEDTCDDDHDDDFNQGKAFVTKQKFGVISSEFGVSNSESPKA